MYLDLAMFRCFICPGGNTGEESHIYLYIYIEVSKVVNSDINIEN